MYAILAYIYVGGNSIKISHRVLVNGALHFWKVHKVLVWILFWQVLKKILCHRVWYLVFNSDMDFNYFIFIYEKDILSGSGTKSRGYFNSLQDQFGCSSIISIFVKYFYVFDSLNGCVFPEIKHRLRSSSKSCINI
jgi:hypothetical protein